MNVLVCAVGELKKDDTIVPRLKQCFADSCKVQGMVEIFSMLQNCDNTISSLLSKPEEFCDIDTNPKMQEMCIQFAPKACSMGPMLYPPIADFCGVNVAKTSTDYVEQCKNTSPPTTASPTSTPAPTATTAPTATASPTSTPAPTVTASPSSTGAPTSTPVPTATQVPTATPAPTSTGAPTSTSAPTLPGTKNCTCSGECSAWADPHVQNMEGTVYKMKKDNTSVTLYKADNIELVVRIERSFIRSVSLGGMVARADRCAANGVGILAKLGATIDAQYPVYNQEITSVVECHQGPKGCLATDSCQWYLNVRSTKTLGFLSSIAPNMIQYERETIGATGDCLLSKNSTSQANWQCSCH